MKLTKKQEIEARNLYETFWESLWKADTRALASCFDKDFRQIGTTEAEVFFGKIKAVAFVKKTAKQIVGTIELRNRKITVEPIDGLVFINELADTYVKIENKWKFYSKLRATSFLRQDKTGWKLIQQHLSFPDTKADKDQTIGLEKISKENIELRDAIKRRTIELEQKNKELEIETSLEKVRAVAMAMKKADDMLSVCKTISQQLAQLGVKEIRNVQTAIFYVNRGTYMNYEYYAKHTKTFITEVEYKNHKIQLAFAKKMMKGPNEEVLEHLKGKKLQDWYAYQKTTNQFADKYIRKAHSLNYYWYSLGPVALGISTYYPLSKEETDLFKRFLKVFELAYRRYLDIEKAEAQTREAQIETSLERIRAASLAMRDSAALGGIIYKLYGELTKLDAQLDRCFIMIVNPENKGITWWMAGQEGLLAENGFFIPMNQHASHLWYLDCWRKRRKKWQYLLEGKEKRDWDRFGFSKTELARLPEFIKKFMAGVNKINLTGSSDQFGSLVTGSFEPLPDEQQDIISRFTIAFNQAYIRFLDLQKAEAQAREAQIETALERVRSRAMAMHTSQELNEVALELRKQMGLLGQKDLEVCAIHLYDANDSFESWSAMKVPGSESEIIQTQARFPNKGIKIIDELMNHYTKGSRDYVLANEGEKLVEWFKVIKAHAPALHASIMQSVGKMPLKKLKANWSVADFSGGALVMVTYGEPDEQSRNLLRRSANVFEQAYIRFNDLLKAEAQAREAQIEAALEKVRSRSLAMHNSDELNDVVNVLFDKLKELHIPFTAVGIAISIEGSKDLNAFVCGENDKEIVITNYRLPYFDNIITRDFNTVLEKQLDFFVGHYSKEEKDAFYTYVIEHTPELRHLPDHVKRMIFECTSYTVTMIAANKATFNINDFQGKVLADHEVDIIQRFAKVFDQAYTRFLDLQKAEAQAREAQIEAALERVRSRTMAMQRSNELLDVASILFQQVKALGVPQWNCGFNIWNTGDKEFTYYPGTPDGVISPSPCKIPLTEHPVFMRFDESRNKGEELLVYEKKGEEQEDHYRYMLSLPGVGDLLRSMLDAGFTLPTFQIDHVANFAYGNLIFITFEHFPEMHDVFKRFAKVFEQTYTRFLDLQKAETQAREAEIELGLERVRARAMAMQKSDELSALVDTLFKELTKLDFALNWCIINIIDEPSLTNIVWAANPETNKPPESYLMKFEDYPFHHSMLKGYRERKTKHVYVIEGKEKTTYDDYLFRETEWRRVPKAAQDASRAMKRYVASFSFSNFGGLQTVGEEYLSEENLDILSRFGKVFDLTYTRFNDLQKAEAQAREAQIEAALERVRSKTMAMHNSNDVGESVAVLFDELIKLGLLGAEDRCGIGIMQPNEMMELWTAERSTGKTALTIGHLNMKLHPLLKNVYQNWLYKKETYRYVLEGEDKYQYHEAMLHQANYKIKKDYYSAHEKIIHSDFFFKEGCLYVFSLTELTAEANSIFTRFTNVFGQTYRRYLDLQKAEAQAIRAEKDLIAIKEAKQKAEEALTELQSTQKQLIQAEKMASLGELTAGIAHEIQNPLNFVNNFSEVSKELLDEMREAIEKGDTEDAKEIMNDVIQNLEKINHHGKRADGIVKGMLQHSSSGSGKKEPTNINTLADEYLRLAYHGLRAKDKSFNATMKTDFDETIGNIKIIPQDMGRVILNLITNAFYVVSEKSKQNMAGYEPTVEVSTNKVNDKVEVKVKDNGNGIPQKILDKIFQPFFTTKPTGQGTGLGLSLSYDIVQAHGGELKVETEEGEGTAFIIQLPINTNNG